MSTFPRRAALIGALAAVGVLFAASDASATVEPPVVTGNNLTVTSDAAGDTITLAVASGVVTVNGTATTLAADANAHHVARTSEHPLVTWTQQGHTCTIVASSAVPEARLVDLAASRNS